MPQNEPRSTGDTGPTGAPGPGYPPWPTLAGELARTALTVTQGVFREGRLLCPPEVEAGRRAVCCSCAAFVAPRQRCVRCGCYLRLKWRLATVRCPDGHW